MVSLKNEEKNSKQVTLFFASPSGPYRKFTFQVAAMVFCWDTFSIFCWGLFFHILRFFSFHWSIRTDNMIWMRLFRKVSIGLFWLAVTGSEGLFRSNVDGHHKENMFPLQSRLQPRDNCAVGGSVERTNCLSYKLKKMNHIFSNKELRHQYKKPMIELVSTQD